MKRKGFFLEFDEFHSRLNYWIYWIMLFVFSGIVFPVAAIVIFFEDIIAGSFVGFINLFLFVETVCGFLNSRKSRIKKTKF